MIFNKFKFLCIDFKTKYQLTIFKMFVIVGQHARMSIRAETATHDYQHNGHGQTLRVVDEGKQDPQDLLHYLKL